jgi:uncharacterized alkaline shock family protein YloU
VDARTLDTPLGRITISPNVIAQIVARTAEECYGVVGLSSKGAVLGRLRSRQAVSVADRDGGIGVELGVVVEYGLNLAEVAATVRSRVTYELERLTRLKVAAVDVTIKDVRASA